MKKASGNFIILNVYTCVPKTIMIWCMLPEIWNTTDITFLSIWAIFCYFTILRSKKVKILKKRKKYQEISPFYTCAPQMTIIWCMVPEIWSTTDIIICHFDYFGSLSPNTLENQNVEKMKKVPGDIIILHLYSTYDSHMMYDSWDIGRNGQNIFVILDKMQILSFYTSAPKTKIISCVFSEIRGATDWNVCHSGSFFPLLPH